MPPGDGDLWVFAYGSLMWDPRFPHVESRPATLHGYHRALCILSVRNRGTPDRPGLVVGLDRGGSCRGHAFRVAVRDVEATRAYLEERELGTGVYVPATRRVRLAGGESVAALAFVSRRDHPQYAGTLTADDAARLVVQGRGAYGTALDYLQNVVRHLDAFGIADGPLHRVLAIAEAAATGEGR
ncbi:MAG: gamma-glutamylcyclotransferase [Rhodospirillales bacterium]